MDSDDENDSPMRRNGVPASIILINVFDPKSQKAAQVAHAATCQLVRYYLKTDSSHLVGVTLFGTQNNTGSVYNVQCVTDIIPLNTLCTKHYKDLENTDLSQIAQAKELMLSDVLFHCNKKFSNCKRQLSSRTLFLLSSFDIPPENKDQLSTLELVKDLVDLNIEIRMINISKTQYEPDPFYEKFVIEANKNLHVKVPEPVWDDKVILQQMIAESDHYLAVSKLNFDIGNDISIGVGVYKLLKGRTLFYPKCFNVHKETNEILTTMNKSVKKNIGGEDNNDEPKEVLPLQSELVYQQEYCGEKIIFTNNEYKSIKNPFGPTMLKLLGFKLAKLMSKEKWFLKNCYFLFPNELGVEGSTVAFKALHQACIETGVVAVCVLSTRVNARPLIVALSPCCNPLGLDIPIGFDVIPLPFVENVRDLPILESDEDIKVSEQQKTVLNDIINNLKFDYKPDMFEDPKSQKILNILEAKALQGNDVEFNDKTQHDDVYFENIEYEKFYELFGPFMIGPAKRNTSSKETTSSKKVKIEDIDEDLLSERVTNNQLEKYTVDELKNILKFKNVSEPLTGLKKCKLIDLVYRYFT